MWQYLTGKSTGGRNVVRDLSMHSSWHLLFPQFVYNMFLMKWTER